MLGNPVFNFQTIPKINAAFGWIFSDISIIRQSGSVTKTIKIPIDFASKEKMDIRKREDPNAGTEATQRHVEIILPRLAYTLTGFSYDASRKLPAINYRVSPVAGSPNPVVSAMKQLNPVPMIFNYTLVLQTRTLEDGYAIVEQILPFFQPDYVVPILDIPEMNIERDIVFVLTGSNSNDSYDGSFTEKRILEWTFDFEARGHMYPAIKEKKIIKSSDIRFNGSSLQYINWDSSDQSWDNTISPWNNVPVPLVRILPPEANINDPFTIQVNV